MTKAVFFGASTIEGVGASSPDKRFTSIISRILGWEEINLGISGSNVTGRDDSGMVIDEETGIGRVTDVLDAKPDIVVILYGANDFASAKPLGSIEKFQQGTFWWDYDTMLRGLLFELKPEQIVLSTLFFRMDAKWPNAAGFTLEDYNDAILQIGARNEVRVLDAGTEGPITRETFSKFSSDDYHLNDDGYSRLAAFFIEALKS